MRKEYSEPPEITLKEGLRWIPLEALYDDAKDVPVGLPIAYRIETGDWFNQNVGVTTRPDPGGIDIFFGDGTRVWGNWVSHSIPIRRNTPLEQYLSNGTLMQNNKKNWMNLKNLWTIYKSPDYEDKTLEDAFV